MSISSRQQEILNLLNERVFISVNELSSITFSSPSSIRRDLTKLQNMGLVKRSHGGVTLPEPVNGVASFYERIHHSIKEKRIIAKKASSLLKNGQSILLDSSSTVSFLLPYIAKLSAVTVFTNNLSTALTAIDLGIDTHCTGGHSREGSGALVGTEACKFLESINPDVLFFASQALDSDGLISDAIEDENYVRQLMLRCAKKKVFLCDSTKFQKRRLHKLADLDDIDIAVFDKPFEELRCKITLL